MSSRSRNFASGFEKVAYDGNYVDEHGNFVVHANRAMGHGHDLHKSLRTALKDPTLEVEIFKGDTGEVIKDPAKVEQHLKDLEQKYKTGMAFERHHGWSIKAKKEHFKDHDAAAEHIYSGLSHKVKGHKKTAAPAWYYEMNKTMNPLKNLKNQSTVGLKSMKAAKGLGGK